MNDFTFRSKCYQALGILRSIEAKLEACTTRHEKAEAKMTGRKQAA